MQIKPKTLVKMSVKGTAPSHSRTDIAVRDVTSVIDEPVARGGTNEGPSPTETAISALIGCTNVIGNKCADKLGVDIGHLAITAEFELDRRGVTLMEEIETPFKSIALNVVSDGSCSQEDLTRVAQETAKYCPLAKLFRNSGTELTESWTKAA